MAQNPKYDNDMVNLGYLNKRLSETEKSINNNNNSILQLPKNYSTPPNPPYYRDSLLCYGNKIYRCNTTKLQGTFSWNDWTIVATDDTTVSDFIKNTYEVEKLEIQEQIDGKVQTYYQETDPAKEWTTDLDKGRHVGDYWYNTTNDTQWRYNQITTSSPITYGWGQVNIPKSVFDTIDTKKSIYTEKPTSYKKDDLWIIEETISDNDLPVGTEENPIAKGDWVFSIADSDIYNKEHWIKRDEDVSLSYLEQHYYTTTEIDSSLEIVERNTESKITKATEEISLNVSQTYTTKEEHTSAINDFDEQIGTINETITKHKATLSDLSVEVGEVSASVESVETRTEELTVDVNGVKESIIPTATATGSNIYVEDASDNPLIQLEIEGKNTQETRSGKNLTKYPYITGSGNTSNGITFDVNEDGTIIINGQNDGNGNSAFSLTSINNYSLPIGTYYMIDPQNSSITFVAYDGSTYNGIGSYNNYSFTLSEKKNIWLYIQIPKGDTTTFDNFKIYPMLSTSSDLTSDDYEQYGVQPSPDYPSEIVSVGYENLFDNIFRQGDVGSSNVTNRLYSRNDTIVKTNKIYTVNTNLDTSIYRYAINISTESFPNYNHTYDSGWKTTSSFTFNSSIDGYFGIVVSKIDNSTITPDELENAWFVLSKSTQQHSYIPYGKYGVEVEIAGRNKLKGLETAVSDNNYWFNTTQPYFTPLEDGWGKFDYDNTNGTSTVFINAKVKLSAVELKENTTYTIVTEIRNSNISENSGTFFQIVTANPTIAFQQARSLGYSNINQGGIFKTTSTTKESFDAVECAIDTYLRLAARTKGTVEARISIFEDDVDITNFVYEEYKSNISVFELDQPLRSLPNGVKDIAYIKNNKLYVDRYVGSVVLDGSEGWKDDWQNSSFTDYIQFYLPSSFLNNNYVIYKMSNPNAFCNCFKLLETVWSYEGEFIALNPNTTYTLQVKMLITDIPDLATFKEWLSTHNTQVDYELATPITEEIGGIKMPSTFKGVNHISTTDGLEPTINIEYVRDTILSNYVEGQISNLKTIEERHYSELVVEDENIKASVSETQSSLDGTISNMNKLESNLTSQSATLEIISTNIDKTTGEVREVTTTNGLKFNSDGINLYNGEDSYNTLIDNVGTYYKDGDTVISETTKDGFMATNSKNKGQHSYSYDDTNNIYEFTDERIEVDGEYAYATFYNGEE